MHPKDISIFDYTYHLPKEKIALYPIEARSESKLLVYNKDTITGTVFSQISSQLPQDALLLFNTTKVVKPRIIFKKESGAEIEIFCLEPGDGYENFEAAFAQQASVCWKCFVGGAQKWNKGMVLKKIIENGNPIELCAENLGKISDGYLIKFYWQPAEISFAEIQDYFGLIPLPPYIKRQAEISDEERYQTVFAEKKGSVAAPTAGLHFTQNILDDIAQKNIITEAITLHVGAGTFKPVKAEKMDGHLMHAEHFEVSKKAVENILSHLNKNIIATGTTTLRAIESLYYLGIKLMDNKKADLAITQWEPYDNDPKVPPTKALEALADYMQAEKKEKLTAATQIIIAPGYKPKIATGLITNFHQPQSTLLLLIAALIGDSWRQAYQYALENDFRFLSYGDSSLLFFERGLGFQQRKV